MMRSTPVSCCFPSLLFIPWFIILLHGHTSRKIREIWIRMCHGFSFLSFLLFSLLFFGGTWGKELILQLGALRSNRYKNSIPCIIYLGCGHFYPYICSWKTQRKCAIFYVSYSFQRHSSYWHFLVKLVVSLLRQIYEFLAKQGVCN